MNRETILKLLQRRPFVPFEVQLSNGLAVQIRHPEVAVLGKSQLIVVDPETDALEIVSLLHIASVRSMQAA